MIVVPGSTGSWADHNKRELAMVSPAYPNVEIKREGRLPVIPPQRATDGNVVQGAGVAVLLALPVWAAAVAAFFI